MNGKAAECSVQIDGLGLSLAVGLSGLLQTLDALKTQMIDRPVHAVGADGDVAVGPGPGVLVHSAAGSACTEELPILYSNPNMAHSVLAVRSASASLPQLMPT